MIFERLIEKLLPTGRAWFQLPSKIMSAIFGGLADEMEFVRLEALKVKDSILPQVMDVEFIPDWEKRFALSDGSLTEQERRDRLDAQWQPGGQTLEYIEGQLQSAGFDVHLVESPIPATASKLGDHILGDFVLEGNVVDGQVVTRCTSNTRPIAQLGEFELDEQSSLSHPAKADPCKGFAGLDGASLGMSEIILGDGVALDANRARFIVNNIDDTLDPQETCPMIEEACIFIFFIQGPGAFGDAADIPAARYREFREMVLKYKPARTWAACFLNLV